MALSSQVINLIWPNLVNQMVHVDRIGHIAVMELEPRMVVEPVNSLGVQA